MHENLLRKRPVLINCRNVVFFSDNTRPPLGRITQEKILDCLVSSTPISISTRLCTKWFWYSFFSTKYFEWHIFLQKIWWKRLWKTSWVRKLFNFNGEDSTSHLINGKRWFKVMAYILMIEINSLLNYEWILRKRKLWLNLVDRYFWTECDIYIYIYICTTSQKYLVTLKNLYLSS